MALTDDALWQLVCDHFSTQRIIDNHTIRADEGLRRCESEVVSRHLSAPGRLLDIGCRGGREAVGLAHLGYDVVGIDISPELVDAAIRHTEAVGLSIEFRVTDGKWLPFPDAHFDQVVMWAQAFGYLPGHDNRIALLRECHRVLIPDGRFSFSVHDHDQTLAKATQSGNVVADSSDGLESGDYVLEDAPATFFHLYHGAEIHNLCTRAGLDVVDCRLASDYGDHQRRNLWIIVCR